MSRFTSFASALGTSAVLVAVTACGPGSAHHATAAATTPEGSRVPAVSASAPEPAPAPATVGLAGSSPPPAVGTSAAAVTSQPVAGPRIFVVHADGFTPGAQVRRVVVDSVTGTQLDSYPLTAQPITSGFDISPDGSKIAYLEQDGVHVANAVDGSADHVIHAVPKDPTRQYPGSVNDGPWSTVLAWAPDSHRLAISYRGDLWIGADDGSGFTEVVRNVTTVPEQSGFGGVSDSISWSPAGDQLLVGVNGSAKLLLSPAPTLRDTAAVLSADGTTVHVLPANLDPSGWSPDGARLLGARTDNSVVTFLLDGSDVRTVASAAAGDSINPAGWSPDGTTIAGLVVHPGTATVSVMLWPVAGGQPTTLATTSTSTAASGPLWVTPTEIVYWHTTATNTVQAVFINVTDNSKRILTYRQTWSGDHIYLAVTH